MDYKIFTYKCILIVYFKNIFQYFDKVLLISLFLSKNNI